VAAVRVSRRGRSVVVKRGQKGWQGLARQACISFVCVAGRLNFREPLKPEEPLGQEEPERQVVAPRADSTSGCFRIQWLIRTYLTPSIKIV
jgi:hypothetical protein